MTKVFGAGIFCSVCQAQPFPDPGSGLRESFDLQCVGDRWLCEQHRLRKQKRASRPAPKERVSSADDRDAAVEAFEALLRVQAARFNGSVDDEEDPLAEAFEDFWAETERGLGELKRALGS